MSRVTRIQGPAKELSSLESSFGAEEGTRTPTPLRVHGPEPCASANSATSALKAEAGTPPPILYSTNPRPHGQTSRGIGYRASQNCPLHHCQCNCGTHRAGAVRTLGCAHGGGTWGRRVYMGVCTWWGEVGKGRGGRSRAVGSEP